MDLRFRSIHLSKSASVVSYTGLDAYVPAVRRDWRVGLTPCVIDEKIEGTVCLNGFGNQ
jgi:hypothetical protein